MYPVYVNEPGTELPENGEYYVVAGNGIWFRKETALFTGFIPVPSVSFLDDLDITGNTVKCLLPKVPHGLVVKIKKFFTTVFRKYHGEACVLLYFDAETKQYTVEVPRQWVTHGSVQYIRPSLSHKKDGLAVGTIHSHCDFGAFHSGTDHEDETTFDGLHITFGDITNNAGMSVSASIVINGMRCRVDPLAFLEGVTTEEHKVYRIAQPPWESADYEAALVEVNGWLEKVNNGNPPRPWTDEAIRSWKEKNGYEED